MRKRRAITVCQYNVRPKDPAYSARSSYQRDEQVMQSLVTAGAMVALADGSVARVERDELVNFIDRQGFVPAISPERIAAVFDTRLRELDDRNGPHVIVEKFRPIAGLSLGSVVMRVAQRVADADGMFHPRERQTIDLIRLILAKASLSGRRAPDNQQVIRTAFLIDHAHHVSRFGKAAAGQCIDIWRPGP